MKPDSGSVTPRGSSWQTGLFVHSAVDDSDLTPLEFRVYAHLCRRVGDELRAWGSQRDMAAHCRVSIDTIGRTLKALEDKGWIQRVRRERDDGGRKPDDIYVIGLSAATPPAKTDTPTRAQRDTPPAKTDTPHPLVAVAEVKPLEVKPLEVNPLKVGATPAPEKSEPRELKAKFVESALNARLTPGKETTMTRIEDFPGAARLEARQDGAAAQKGAVLAVSKSRDASTGILEPKFYADLKLLAPCLDTEAGRAAWADWLEARREMRKPVSQSLAVRHLKSVASLPPLDAVACLEYSAAKGYTGLFPERYEKGGAGVKMNGIERKEQQMIEEEAYALAALKAHFGG